MRLTAAQQRVLDALAAADGETLLHNARPGFYRVGPDGVTGHWRTFDALMKANLITIDVGFAFAEYAAITEKGRAAARKTPGGV